MCVYVCVCVFCDRCELIKSCEQRERERVRVIDVRESDRCELIKCNRQL